MLSNLQEQFGHACALLQAGRAGEAERRLNGLISAQPGHPDILNALAMALDMQGRSREAAGFQSQAVGLLPGSAVFRFNLGNILMRCEDPEGAEQQYLAAIQLDSGMAEPFRGLGNLCLSQGRPEAAESCLRRALEINPLFYEASYDLGLLLQDSGDLAAAERQYRACLVSSPSYPPALNGLGMLLMRSNRVADAEECFNRALSADPGYLQARCNLAVLATWQGRLEYAIAELTDLCSLAPADGDIHFNLSLALLTAGMMEEGFREHEWRFRKAAAVAKRYEEIPRWNGESLTDKTLLIYAEQGYGDSIQFVRYATVLAESGATVLVEGQDATITPLLSVVKGVTAAFSRGESPPCQPDFQIPMMSIPCALGRAAWPAPAAPYLHLDESAVGLWREKLAQLPGCKIGIAWAGRPEHQNDANRSIPPGKLDLLRAVPDVSWISLQFGAYRPASPGLELFDPSDSVNNFMGSAALLSSLDLVITVDSAVAHLAGALGVPVWLLLPWNPDWRWMRDRTDSPWYPSMRIFRQREPGDWGGALGELVRVLSGYEATTDAG